MRIKNNIELQTDEKNIKVCTWLEHMFSNICFQNQISGTTNVLLIKRKCEHHYKGSDRYMEIIYIYFFFAPTWCPPQVQPLGERTSLHMSAAEEHLFPPPKSATDPPGCFRTSQPMCFTCLQLKNSCFPPPKSAPDPPRWPLGRSGSI